MSESKLDKAVDFVLVPVIEALIVTAEAVMAILGLLLGLWPIWIFILIMAACIKILSG